jgi:predicted 3-demethylubiquinone-9 3-methyltransferase (glyoxalase superfamily)
MSQIIPYLRFNDEAEEAAKYYVSVFKDAKKTISAATPTPGRCPAEPRWSWNSRSS